MKKLLYMIESRKDDEIEHFYLQSRKQKCKLIVKVTKVTNRKQKEMWGGGISELIPHLP